MKRPRLALPRTEAALRHLEHSSEWLLQPVSRIYAVVLSVVVLAGAGIGLVLLSNTSKHDQLAACRRVNVIAIQQNSRNRTGRQTRDSLEALTEAQTRVQTVEATVFTEIVNAIAHPPTSAVRETSAQRKATAEFLAELHRLAVAYGNAYQTDSTIHDTEAQIKFIPLPVLDCKRVIG